MLPKLSKSPAYQPLSRENKHYRGYYGPLRNQIQKPPKPLQRNRIPLREVERVSGSRHELSAHIQDLRTPLKLKHLLQRLPAVNHIPGNHSAHIRDSREPSPLNRVQRLGSGQLASVEQRPRSIISQEKSRIGQRHKIDSYIVFDGAEKQGRNEMYIVQNKPNEVYPDYKKHEKVTLLASPAKLAEHSVDYDYTNRNNDYSGYLLPRDDEISIRVKKLGNIYANQHRPTEDPRTLLRKEQNRGAREVIDMSPYSQGHNEKVVLPLPQLAQNYKLPNLPSLRDDSSSLPKVTSKPTQPNVIRRPEYYSRLPAPPSSQQLPKQDY